MFKGVHLTLMIGPAVPVAVSKEVVDALESVKVTSSATGVSGFELNFRIDVHSALQTLFLIGGGVSIPLVRVVVVVTVNGETQVLVDGVITDHHVGTDDKDGYTTLTIIGEDLTRVMDWIDFSGLPFPAMPAEAQVALTVAKYAMFGIVPMVIPSILIDVPLPTDRIPRQQGTDLKHIRRLAAQVGYVFYLDPGPTPGTSVAYWGPQIKVGEPQPALSVDADAATNVKSLTMSFDNNRKVMPILWIQEPFTKLPLPIPIPDVTPLDPPLGAIPPIPKNFMNIQGTAKFSAIRAALIALAKVSQTSDVVSATGSLDVMRYGQTLKPRRLVGLRGVGPAFDGLYYVESVTHDLKRGQYEQQFKLTRNGLVSTFSSVPT
jgi:hypothetical protein